MNIYLASRFALQQEHLPRIKLIESIGHKVTSRWITEEPALTDEDDPNIARDRADWAQRDVEDVMDADLLIFWAEGPDVPGRARGGRHVEFGIAVVWGIHIWVIGPQENIFHYLPTVRHFDSFNDVLLELEGVHG